MGLSQVSVEQQCLTSDSCLSSLPALGLQPLGLQHWFDGCQQPSVWLHRRSGTSMPQPGCSPAPAPRRSQVKGHRYSEGPTGLETSFLLKCSRDS